jgi:hypothetical protein
MPTRKDYYRKRLVPLIEEAEDKGLWFSSPVDPYLWISPEEMRMYNEAGQYLWDPENFKLKNPKEHITELETDVMRSQGDLDRFVKRLNPKKPDAKNIKIIMGASIGKVKLTRKEMREIASDAMDISKKGTIVSTGDCIAFKPKLKQDTVHIYRMVATATLEK